MTRGPRQSDRSPADEIASECIAGRIRLLNRTITSLFDEALRPVGLTAGQLNMLTFVAKGAPIAPGALADLLKMEKSTVSRNLARMERNGWVRIKPGDAGHTQIVELAAKGRTLLEKARPHWRKAQDAAERLLGVRGTDSIRKAFDTAWSNGGRR